MATPMSARRRPGASLTPSPVTATTAPSRLQRVDDGELLLGPGSGEDTYVRAAVPSLIPSLIASLVHSVPNVSAGLCLPAGDAAVDDAVAGSPDPDLLGDVPGGPRMVSGDDHGTDASACHVIDRRGGAVPDRVTDTQHAERPNLSGRSGGDGEDPQTGLRIPAA